jgi:IMP dehydrogenase/GMP reductase
MNDLLLEKLVEKGVLLKNSKTQDYDINPLLDLFNSEVSYGFEDIAITQQKNICKSRLDANTSSEIIRGVTVDIPLIASNMSTVINSDFYIKLFKLGAFAFMHRAASDELLESEIAKIAKQCQWTAASIGIDDAQFDLAKKLINAGANILVIDIAHGYTDSIFDLAKKLKLYSKEVKVVIGNATNPEIMYECGDWVDAIKVGIAQGFACETKNTAGCTEKQFSAVLKFKSLSRKLGIPIISDGGTREPADLVKAIAAGANSVIAGKIFAACPESAAETELVNGVLKKVYAGMASRYVQDRWKGGLKPGTCPEGGVRYLDVGEGAEKLLERYGGALKSGITYAGANDVVSFQDKVKFVRFAK